MCVQTLFVLFKGISVSTNFQKKKVGDLQIQRGLQKLQKQFLLVTKR